jgi:hypothetical protein
MCDDFEKSRRQESGKSENIAWYFVANDLKRGDKL